MSFPDPVPSGWSIVHNAELKLSNPITPTSPGCIPGPLTCTASDVNSAMALCAQLTTCAGVQCPYAIDPSNPPLFGGICGLWGLPVSSSPTLRQDRTTSFVLIRVAALAQATTTTTQLAAVTTSLLPLVTSQRAASPTTKATVTITKSLDLSQSTASSSSISKADTNVSSGQDILSNVPLIAGLSAALVLIAVCIIVGLVFLIKRRGKGNSVNPRTPPSKIVVKDALAAKQSSTKTFSFMDNEKSDLIGETSKSSHISSSPTLSDIPQPKPLVTNSRKASLLSKKSVATTSIRASSIFGPYENRTPSPPPGDVYIAIYPYEPNEDDEIKLKIGDVVSVEYVTLLLIKSKVY
ncbi:hypothetical protein HK098_005386 [Nowakowskiella sp. JEL0407]|nr:hypothetical protein HK098_005386 [Nowakowskiella sp. JEL0407]